jgi:hypothetical protein
MDGIQQRIDDTARFLLRQGLSCMPIGQDKTPAIKWMDLIDTPLKAWNFPGCNLGLLTGERNGIVVVDCDSEQSYIGWLKTKPPTPLRVRTKRGMQFFYRHPKQYIKSDSHIRDATGFEYDVKGDRSYVLFPPSVRSGHQYQICICTGNISGKLVPFSSLPVFQPEWRPEKPSGASPALQGKIRDGVQYIRQIKAVSGSGGDKETFRAACKLIESGMTESEALVAMLDWNATNAEPPWTASQLLYKVRCAIREAGI